jgi:hypothetical protein
MMKNKKTLRKIWCLFSLILWIIPATSLSQFDGMNIDEDDLNIGGDIFNDFNEDLDDAQVLEDERFYRYGRFFAVNFSLGLTTFQGNRGSAYIDDHPTFGMGLFYFLDFDTSMGIGWAFSKHHFFIDEAVNGFNPNPPGTIEVNVFRFFFGGRYYLDTANLGTAITYANPYLTARMEYWYITNKFSDLANFGDDTGGGFGFGLGVGGEFPIKIKESYLGVEVLLHQVNFHDKFTQRYRALPGNDFGYDDLTGNSVSAMVSYVMNW